MVARREETIDKQSLKAYFRCLLRALLKKKNQTIRRFAVLRIRNYLQRDAKHEGI